MVWSISKGVLRTQKQRTKITALTAAFLLAISSLSSALAPFMRNVSAASSGDVWITAAMPHPTSSGTEYVTVKNNTPSSVSLDNWVVNDGFNHAISTALSLASGAEATICENPAADSACTSGYTITALGLNDDGDTIALKDSSDNQIDQVTYASSSEGVENTFSAHTPAPVTSSLNAEEFVTTNVSYKGISVGFNAKDFSGVSAVTVDMKRADGTHAIKHGTSDLFNLIDANTAPHQFTAPFVIQSGSYNPAGDSYWTNDATTWTSSTVPTEVTISVTDANGTKTVTNTNFLQSDSAHPSYASLLPLPVKNTNTGETFATIQDAINDSDTDGGDTIKAAAGAYPEQVHITKGVTINGANSGVNPNTGTRSAESIIDNSGGSGIENGFYIDSNVSNVTINGFEFKDVKGATGHESGAVLIKGSSTLATNVTVKDNKFIGTGRGVNKDVNASFDGLNVEDNYFKDIGVGVTPDTYSPVKVQGPCNNGCSNLEISGNTVDTTTYAAFLLFDVDGVNISNNDISNTDSYAIGVGPTSSTGGDTTIENNTIDNSGASGTEGAIRIKSGAFNGSVTVQGNTVTNSDIGVSADNGANVTGTFKVTKNKLLNVSKTGVQNNDSHLLDALNNWWGDASGPTDTNGSDNSQPATNGTHGSAAVGAVKYDIWCTVADCSTNNNTPPAAPTDLYFTQGSNTLTCDGTSATNSNASGTLHWTAPSGSVSQYIINPDYPDSSGEYTMYGGGSDTSHWVTGNFAHHGEGVYTYTIKAKNSAGFGPSASCDVIYDHSSPSAHFTTAPPSYVNGNFHVEATASDNAKLKNAFFDVRDSSGWVAGCVSGTFSVTYTNEHKDATLSCDINTANLVDGQTYTLRVHASDYAGYGGGEQQDLTFDKTAPNVSNVVLNGKSVNIARDQNCGPTDFNPVKGKVDLSATITDDFSGVKNAKYKIRKVTNGGCTQTNIYQSGNVNMDNPSADNWITLPGDELDTNNVPADGNYTIQMTITDNVGNTTTKYVDITVDNTRPTITFVNPADFNNSTYNQYFQTGPNLEIAVSDPGGSGVDSSNAVLHVYNAGDNSPAKFCSGTTCDTSSLPDGNYYVKAGVTDAAGNNQTVTKNFTIDNAQPNNATTKITSPTNGKIFDTGSFNITGTANDSLSGINPNKVYITVNEIDAIGGSHAGNTSFSNEQANYDSSSHTFSYNGVTGLSDGYYRIQLKAYDKAGNLRHDHIDVQVDKTAPNAPTASPAGGNYTGTQQVSLNASDNSGGSGVDAIYYTTDGSTPDSSSTEYTGPITVSHDETIKAIAYDKAGNSSTVLSATYGIAPVIDSEQAITPTTSSVIVTWTTDEPATSRVIYDTTPHSDSSVDLASGPNYGYAHSTVEDSAKVTNHSVTVTGLTPGTTYYFRAASHGSPETVSGQFSANTKNNPSNQSSNSGGSGGTTISNLNAFGSIGNNIATVFGVGVNGGAAGAAAATNGNNQAVLGAQTDKSDNNKHFGSSNSKVLGDNTDKDKTCSKLFGICWYYWIPIVVVVAGIVYYFFRRRSATEA